MKMCIPRCGWVCFFIRTDLCKCGMTSLSYQRMLCSEWVPSEWESKELIKTSQFTFSRNFEVFSFILASENKCDCSPHKSALSCFSCVFCALYWTFMSLPVSRGVCSQFSLLASCIYIYIQYSIYRPSVSLVLCELLSVMVMFSCGCWLIVCFSVCMKCLHIDPCLCLFSPFLHNVVSLTSASLCLYLV